MKKLLLLLVILFAVSSCEAQQKKQAVKLVPPSELSKEMAEEKGQVIDVRTPKEYQSGHIKGFTTIIELNGGIDAWLEDGKPVVK